MDTSRAVGSTSMEQAEQKIKQIVADNKYFTPNIEDIRVGYECEIKVHDQWLKETIEKLIYIEFYGEQITNQKIRVPYLTKEQIEAEGWVDQNDRGMAENSGYLFTKGNYKLWFWTIHPRLKITNNWLGTVLETNIMEKVSINELRYICKLLNIQ